MPYTAEGDVLPEREPQVKLLIEAAADALEWLATMSVDGIRITDEQWADARLLAQNLRRHV